jgi:hypothetical protein
MVGTDLAVVLPFYNPMRWLSRSDNFKRAEDHMLRSGVSLYTIELVNGDRDWELPDREGVTRIRVRGGEDVLWFKENQLNIAETSIAPEIKYLAMIDGDVLFHDRHWVADTLHALQFHPIAQISDRVIWLGPKGQYLDSGISLMRAYTVGRRVHYRNHYYHPTNPLELEQGYPGHAWAYRRDYFRAAGGLLDVCILGAADYHMATGLLQLPDRLTEDHDYQQGYRDAITGWSARARQALNGSTVGYVPAITFHLWHGHLVNRGYSTREQILIRNRFDPKVDLSRDHQGLLQFASNKPHLVADIRAYFAERDEDNTWLGHGAHLL